MGRFDRYSHLEAGDEVVIQDDRGDFGKRAVIVDPEPVQGSTQCLVDMDGVLATVARHELAPVRLRH